MSAQCWSGLCARDYLAHLGAFKRDTFRNVWADSLCRRPSGLLRLEHDHRSTVASVVRSSPVAGNEARELRDTRHNRLSQLFLRTLDVADRDFHEYCVHRAPPIRRQGNREARWCCASAQAPRVSSLAVTDRRSDRGALEPLLQVLHVHRELCLRLPPHNQRDEELADAVTLEVQLERHSRPGSIVERLNPSVDVPSNRTVDSPNAPTRRRIEVGDFGSHVNLTSTDPARYDGSRPAASRSTVVRLDTDDALLPVGQVRRIGDVPEDVLGSSRDLDARDDGCHWLPPSLGTESDHYASLDGRRQSARWCRG